MYTTTGEQYCVDVEQVGKEKEKIKMMENAYNVCNNASEPKQPERSIVERTETMAEIEVGTREALEEVNDILNFCLRTICLGNVEEKVKMQPECLMDLQRYNRELAQKIADKAITIKDILVAD